MFNWFKLFRGWRKKKKAEEEPLPDLHAGRRARMWSVESREHYTDEQLDWLRAMQQLKREVGPYPRWDQVLAMAKRIGYRKVGGQSEIQEGGKK